MMTPPLSNLAKEDDESFLNYLKSLPPIDTNNCGASLNSLDMDSTPTFHSYVISNFLALNEPMRNNPLDTSMPQHFSEDSHEEADKVIATQDYSPGHHPLISSDEYPNYLLDFLAMPVPNDIYVQDGAMKDSVEGGNYIQEVGQIEANIEVPDCDGENVISEMQSLTLMDRNPIEWKNASNKMCGSTNIMPFQDLTNKQLNPPNLKRKRTCQIDLDTSCLTNENQEETVDFYKSIPTKKMKIHNSDACNNCKCKKSQCLKLYCVCFATGVYCTGPCSCQNCLNRPINKDKILEARKKIVPKVEDPNKSGCKCYKSNCLKKYCECFKAGDGCSPSCNCRGCENIHGRRIVWLEQNLSLKN
ncbi:unnamed protein product [Vicia faba]|uniref:CRC domain-containing protein n=1 Tax=Vicia faba TaxID=3906 RepID=A0AAV1A3P0_VICFA|nr:unnamed protein product [Vicia faba]